MKFVHVFNERDVEKQSLNHKFAIQSTLRGLRNTVESKHYKYRVVWILILCTSWILIYNVVKLIDEYAAFNAVSEITIKVKNIV